MAEQRVLNTRNLRVALRAWARIRASNPLRPGSPWLRYLVERLTAAVVLTIILVIGTFLMVHLVPGNPARNVLGMTASPSQVARLDRQLGLTEPLVRQFIDYVKHCLQGNLGTSFVTEQPVAQMIGQRLPVTAELAGIGLAIVLLVGIPLGMAFGALHGDARTRGARWAGSSFTVGTSLAGALPEYITGTLLILAFAITLRFLPVQGGTRPNEIVLPAICVAFAPTAVFCRLVRNETASVLGQEYIMTARSKRLPAWRLYLMHVLPNVVTSTLTLGGLILIALLGGTIITENVFNIPGLGSEIVQSILQSDYPATQGIILVLGLLAIAINASVDMALGIFDPRSLTSGRAQ